MPSALKFTTALMAIALVSLSSSGCVSQTALTAAQKEAAATEAKRQALEDQNALLRAQIDELQVQVATVAPVSAPTVTPIAPTTTFAGPNGELVMTVEVEGPKTYFGSLGRTETYRFWGMQLNEGGEIVFPGGELLPLEVLKEAGPEQYLHPILKGKKGSMQCVVSEYQSCEPAPLVPIIAG